MFAVIQVSVAEYYPEAVMKHIEHITDLALGGQIDAASPKAREIYDGPGRKLIEITLSDGGVLAKHISHDPITVLCVSGNGTFRAGPGLEESIVMTPGVLITLAAEVEHEVTAEPDIKLLVTKFRPY